jgi:hypothetical protein
MVAAEASSFATDQLIGELASNWRRIGVVEERAVANQFGVNATNGELVAVSSQLQAIRQPSGQIAYEMICRASVTAADKPARHKF